VPLPRFAPARPNDPSRSPGRRRRAGLVLFAALPLLLLAASPGCGTDAKGVDDCRDIERARCEAAFACGQVSDLDRCRRFYRDHCLHGLAVTPPPQHQVEACVGTIQRATACVKRHGTGVTLADCQSGGEGEVVTTDPIGISYACELVSTPERSGECSFLTPDPIPDPGDDGDGGESGSAGGRG
jgi:hypothetical protein